MLLKCNTRTNIAKNIGTMAKVLTEHGERKELGKIFGVCQLTIRRALEGQTNTALAKKIRKAAITRGGVVVNNTNNKQASI